MTVRLRNERVSDRCRQQQFLGEQRLDRQLFLGNRQRQHADVHIPFQAGLDRVFGQVLGDGDLRLRMIAEKSLEQRRQKIGGDGRDRPHGDLASVRVLSHRPLGAVDGRQDLDRPVEEHAAAIGQADLAARAIEERPAELPLELDDLLAQGGLRHKTLLRGPREVGQLGHCDEITELLQLHSRILLLG